jgi:ADP-ribose pyrophosphatase YjhB (NUDIX family)
MNPRYTPLKPRYTQLAFCPRCGSPYRPADFDGADVVFRCATCGFHFYQNSIPSGVAVVPKADDPSLVVLLTRANEPGRGQLALPGGLLKYGEPPADGARREAREEVLLDVDVDRLLMTHLVDYSYQGGGISVLEVAYLMQPVHADPAGLTTPEASAIDWYDVDAIIARPGTFAFSEQIPVLEAYAALLHRA